MSSSAISTAIRSTLSPGLCLGVLGALALAGCATVSPQQQSALADARTAVQTLESDPMAAQTAGKPLMDARDALNGAEEAAKQHKDDATVEHLAYLAKRQAELGEANIAEARAHNQVSQAEAQRDRVLLEARERDATAAQQQARAAQAQAEAQGEAAAAAQQQALSAQQAQQQTEAELAALKAKPTDRGMVLTLGSVLFDTNGDTLKGGADEQMQRVAEFLKAHAMMQVRVEGHTDSTGSDSYNQALSQRRADSVAHAIENRGVESSRVQSIGRGKDAPVAGNDTAAGRQQNRRVEILFSDAQGQFPNG